MKYIKPFVIRFGNGFGTTSVMIDYAESNHTFLFVYDPDIINTLGPGTTLSMQLINTVCDHITLDMVIKVFGRPNIHSVIKTKLSFLIPK